MNERRAFFRLVLPITAFVVLVNFVTMPLEEYFGDAFAVRIQTIGLLNHGQWTVPPEIASQRGERGQHLFENPDGNWHPKYGILNTLIYVPPLWLEKLMTGTLEPHSSHRPFYLNLLNLVLSAATAFYLVLLVRRYTKSSLFTWLFVLASIYATFWWNYLRAQTFEIYLTLFTLAFFYHFVSAFDAIRSENKQNARNEFLIAATWLGLLCLSKTVYLVLLPALLATFLVFERGFRATEDQQGRRSRICLLFFWLPMGLFVCAILAINWWKFGSPFETGYTQWEQEPRLFSTNLLPGLRGFFADIHGSIFLHFPVLIFALAGWPMFFKRFRFDAAVILLLAATLLLVNSAYINWRGTSCYGPRYLLPILPILSLPFVDFLAWISRLRNVMAKWFLGIGTAAALLYACLQQVLINTLPFFFWYHLGDVLEDEGRAEPIDYLYSRRFSTVNADFLRYLRGRPSDFTENFVRHLTPEEAERMRTFVSETRANYYWFPDLIKW